MNSGKLVAVFTVAVVLSCGTAFAQAPVNEEQGIKPHDALHGGDLDSVSLTNGSLVLHIPLASFPQRGALDLTFTLHSNTKNWQEVNFSAVIRESLELARQRHGLSAEELRFGVEPPGHITLMGNLEQLRTVAANLLENAVKYSGPRREIVVDSFAVLTCGRQRSG